LTDERVTADGLPLLPKGHCVELIRGSGIWAVAGSVGWYVLKEFDLDCQCTRFSFKKHCSHLEALTRHLLARDALNAALPLTAARAKTRATGEKVPPDFTRAAPGLTEEEYAAACEVLYT
jgi:hypothetical protein